MTFSGQRPTWLRDPHDIESVFSGKILELYGYGPELENTELAMQDTVKVFESAIYRPQEYDFTVPHPKPLTYVHGTATLVFHPRSNPETGFDWLRGY